MALFLVGTWLSYWLLGTFVVDPTVDPPKTGHASWNNALYYSLVSFSALGYGDWSPEPTSWVKWVGACQPFVGIISPVALSITLTQRMGR